LYLYLKSIKFKNWNLFFNVKIKNVQNITTLKICKMGKYENFLTWKKIKIEKITGFFKLLKN
jgi:hypothetical protein